MFEVFFVDGSASERSSLRWALNWEHLGFTCTGEAADGELALSLLRRQRPDLLVTALHLPYLNGLELCRRIRQEFPRTKLLIVTDSRRTEDLQSAIEIGVDGYLFKPVDSPQLMESVLRLRAALEVQQRQEEQRLAMSRRANAFLDYERVRFFETLVTGIAPVGELYDLAQSLGIDLRSDEYCFLLCRVHLTSHDPTLLERLERALADLRVLFDKSPQFELFSILRTSFAVLIKSDAGLMDAQVSFCVRNIRRGFLGLSERCQWVVATANPVNRISALSECFDDACEILGYSYLMPGQQVLNPENVQDIQKNELEIQLKKLPTPIPLSEELELFLRTGTPEDGRLFALRCIDAYGAQALEIPSLCRYLMMRIRLATQAYVIYSLHLEADDLLSVVEGMPSIDRIFGREGTLRYLTALLVRSAELRESSICSQYHPSIRQGLRCIDQSFTDPALSLSRVSESAGLSPNYFSTLFRKEVGSTFGEYLTEKRMSRARELLRTTALRSAQIGQNVGYQDAHYFSNLFRKTQGCTPREYRVRSREEQKWPLSGPEDHPSEV